ncbi:PTS sugar transporter subunit IIB [Oceanotoga sp. DSM 15011]|jgi:PTS system ascorbate-specific IIB component|uniref:PTS system ascorbate-specific IIB component n=1 Tax=Oceanotoga teriensis TaxID=515440 RepID=A0AA45C5A4_9BACT|nr:MULTISPECIES: PTS sugar transporter subunit IIB [Oceanotoga]MDN5341922.1 ascorbate system component [Oceanotoga sp.]MDO7976566.1 PTS sugar transporter subunit IIB [Oceanotoga teriensis]PWJ88266.1 PTS system ascorbate-specific IIB component [Oceanotoga teriensis]UYO99283.1 PTS sugar transporter subunit IIB [Oceanotoga sp. DSM 15011]
MRRALVVCRTGMGSSMMLKFKLEQVISQNDLPLEIEHDVLSAVNNYDVDFVITMNDLVEQLESDGVKVVGINDIMDKEEIKSKLMNYLKKLEEL